LRAKTHKEKGILRHELRVWLFLSLGKHSQYRRVTARERGVCHQHHCQLWRGY